MKFRLPLAIGAVVFAGAVWWLGSPIVVEMKRSNGGDNRVTVDEGQLSIKFASLGPSEACACVPAMSPPLTDWRRCAMSAIDKSGLKKAITFTEETGAYPSPHREKLPEGYADAIQVAERQCGPFENVKTTAIELNRQRRAAGFETYILVDFADQLFSGTVRESRSHYASTDGKS
jgi:hypothetical protein